MFFLRTKSSINQGVGVHRNSNNHAENILPHCVMRMMYTFHQKILHAVQMLSCQVYYCAMCLAAWLQGGIVQEIINQITVSQSVFRLSFPRNGTSQIKPGRDVQWSLCPRRKKVSCPSVPLSRDKDRSKNPGTNSSVPGRPGTKSLSEKKPKHRKRTF